MTGPARRAFYVDTALGRAHVRVLGDGPAVLALHDSPGSSAALAVLAAGLGAAYTLVMPDLPGHGATAFPADCADPVGHAASLAAEILGGRPTPVLGYGTGAAVAGRLAARRPDLVPAAVAVGRPRPSRETPPPPGRERLAPTADGGHLLAGWWEVLGAARFAPGWATDDSHRRTGEHPPLAAVHAAAVDTLGWVDGHRPLAGAAWTAGGEAPGPVVDLDRSAGIAEVARALEEATRRHPGAGGAPAAPAASPAPAVGGWYLDGVHVRVVGPAGGGRHPVVVLPAAPGSSAVLAGLVGHLGRTRTTVGVDYPGHGLTDPFPAGGASIDAYVEVVAGVIAALGAGPVDVYGTHSGASIGAELARRHPALVRRLALDGTPLLPPALAADLLRRNFVDLTPDLQGSHITRAWGYSLDRSLWWPWYRRDPSHALPGGPPPPAALHAATTDILRGAGTYHLLYRAALGHDPVPALRALRLPVLACGRRSDPVDAYRPEVAALVTGCASRAIEPAPGEDVAAATARVVGDFFDQPG